jgi:hypothetical protein
MSDSPRRRCSQREIREGRAPRRLAERGSAPHMHGRSASGSAYLNRHAQLSKQLALALAVLILVIASTIVHSANYSPSAGPYVGTAVTDIMPAVRTPSG